MAHQGELLPCRLDFRRIGVWCDTKQLVILGGWLGLVHDERVKNQISSFLVKFGKNKSEASRIEITRLESLIAERMLGSGEVDKAALAPRQTGS